MLGQSAGGLAALEYASQPDPGFKLFVNFAGGLVGHCEWQTPLRNHLADIAKTTKIRSLWFYGSNDSFFDTSVYRENFAQYSANAPNSRLVELGDFKADSHRAFTDFDGYFLWKDALWEEIGLAGLPTKEVNLSYGRPPDMKRPLPSGYAHIADSERIPYISESAKRAYSQFLSMKVPRAYAISEEGHWAWADQGGDPPFRALSACNAQAISVKCKLYAIDNDVVWTIE
jgi:dienelactone hydrolase